MEFFPDEITRHIQSFLDEKEAARTSLLSKQWYTSWSENPDLSLDTNNFLRNEEFPIFALKRIKRYKDQNLKLNSLSLVMNTSELPLLAHELIFDALLLDLNHLTLKTHLAEFTLFEPYTVLPEVFTSDCLKTVNITNGKIDLPLTDGHKVLCSCSNLLSLNLTRVHVTNDMMAGVVPGCPLIEDLTVVDCAGLTEIELSVLRSSLKRFHVEGILHPRATTFPGASILVKWGEAEGNGDGDGSVVDVQKLHQYCNLITLEIAGRVKVDNQFFRFFSHRFPCLQEFELRGCRPLGSADVKIASDSLRYLSLIHVGEEPAKINVPNIHKFSFTTQNISHLLYCRTTSVNWESDLKFIHRRADVSVHWFYRISHILKEFSLSTISLVINLSSGLYSLSNIISVFPKAAPFVENLKIEYMSPVSCDSAVLFGWLLCCRPKFITWFDDAKEVKSYSYESLELVYKELKKHANKIASNRLPCVHGLNDVEMEYYEESLGMWRSARRKVVSESGKMRLRLKWLNIRPRA